MIKILTLSFSQLLAISLNFSIQLILANLYGKEEAGIYFSIISLMNILSVVGLFGINKYYVFLKSKYGDVEPKEISDIAKIFILMSTLSTLLLFVISNIKFPEYLLFNISSMFLIMLTNGIAILTSIVQIEGKIQKVSILQIIIPFLRVIGLLLGVVVFNSHFEGYSYIIIVFTVIVMAYIIFDINKRYPLTSFVGVLKLKKMFKRLAPYAALSITFILYTQGNTFFVGLLSSPENAAVFGLSYLFLNTIFVFPTAIYQKLLAHRLLNLMYNSFDKFKVLFSNMQDILILTSSILILIIYIFSSFLITLLFGESYAESVRVLQLLSLVIPLRLLSISIGTVLSNDDHINERIKVEVIVTLINVVSNVILINMIGLYGAIVSVLITETFLAISLAKVVRNKFEIHANYSLYVPLIIVSLIILVKLNVFLVILITGIMIVFITKPFLKRVKKL